METQPDPQQSTSGISSPVFMGREQAAGYLLRHLNELGARQAAVLIGRRRIGRTAVLQQFAATAGSNLVSVYLPLRQMPLNSERSWLQALLRALENTAAIQRFFLSTHDPLPENGDLRTWLADTYMPAFLKAIRSHRRLILLLDDAEILAQRVHSSELPDDIFDYLHSLLGPQLHAVLAVDLRAESDLVAMAPLVNPRDVYRINRLSDQAGALLIHTQLGADATIHDDALAAVQRAAGGEPALLRRFAEALAERSASSPGAVLTVADIKAVISAIYTDSEDDFQLFWKLLNRDERLVLTALSSLLYEDPLRAINTAMIESWLVETDYPLDTTAINAAVRGLEYRELVEGVAAQVRINAGLFQKWLLENARLGGEQHPHTRSASQSLRLLWPLILLLIATVLFAVFVINNINSTASSNTPVPTVTLAPER